ncbi:MAG TPA: DUF2239 family protein [Steroidobacteraceae bacterium]|jgi:hypothetical protein|nr:DUF2239 family protein [Steroidobacteraceae bacterium]
MPDFLSKPSTAFGGHQRLLSGPLVEVALAVKSAVENGSPRQFLVFDDATGRVIDLDLHGTKADVIDGLTRRAKEFIGSHASRRAKATESSKEEASEHRGRGRPKLGVVAREVTLLPRQWEWLSNQPGGASALLRRLVDDAKRSGIPQQKRRAAQEAAYHFMLAIAGDLPGYEEATRALFADDRPKLERCIAGWPKDIRTHALRLAFAPTDRPTRK